jgi:hypothetical protein
MTDSGISSCVGAGADLFAGLLWNQIDRELQALPDLVITGQGLDLPVLPLTDGSVVHISSGVLKPDGNRSGATAYVNASTLHLDTVDITGGEAHRGGAVALRNAQFSSVECSFRTGTAVDTGGLLDAVDATVDLHDVLLAGGIVMDASTLTFIDSVICGNEHDRCHRSSAAAVVLGDGWIRWRHQQ